MIFLLSNESFKQPTWMLLHHALMTAGEAIARLIGVAICFGKAYVYEVITASVCKDTSNQQITRRWPPAFLPYSGFKSLIAASLPPASRLPILSRFH